uniref:AAA_12 domain-containing protein n=1 Tax=Haemonchus contortus TaxID=6289 RepID=A0A7I4YEP8_HAECO
MSVVERYGAVTGLKIVFEGTPEAVAVSPSVCDFRLGEAEEDEIVSAHSRKNVSCAIRFSEYPRNEDAQRQLCALVRDFLPAHPEEGLLPLKVFKLTGPEKAWIADREGNFNSYRRNPRASQRLMSHLFNAACSALAAVSKMNNDKRTLRVTATVPDLDAFPLRFDFTIADMSSECGWTNQHPVHLWIVGSRFVINATIQQADHSHKDRSIAVRLVVPGWRSDDVARSVSVFNTTKDDVTTVEICAKLGSPPVGAEPLYELISKGQLFGNFSEGSQAEAVLNSVYGMRRAPIGPTDLRPEHVIVSVGGTPCFLRHDQMEALRMADLNLPVIAIQGAFGTGKTFVGALAAARTFTLSNEYVIATTSTNTAVAHFTDMLLRLDDYKHLNILRYVSDSALMEGTPQTPVDLHTILKDLPDIYGTVLSPNDYATCRKYQRGRELLESLMFYDDFTVDLTEAEREEYLIAERDISDLTRKAVAIMFEVRRPAILCITTSALLSSTSAAGIFFGHLNSFTTLIGDEASQIPEPALVALATHLPQARHVYIGDNYQLEPHTRCPRTSTPVRFGARGVMDILLERGVPTADLITTFRAHPLLNELPNFLFYDGTLENGACAEDRQMFLSAVQCPNPALPFIFVDVPGTSTKSLSRSHSNEAEAEVCRQVIQGLLRRNIRPSSIAIIVFYKEQARLLKEFAKMTSVDLHTVDSVQGREKDIVVLLTTRTGFHADRGDFLNDAHRLNVALTRCRHGQFVLGHESSLARLSYWNDILNWASNNGAIITASAISDLFNSR